MDSNNKNVKSRNEAYAEKASTKIWLETFSDENPYLAESCYCHGYELTELVQKKRFVDVLYLLFRGELPNDAEASLLEAFMVASMNPGPRHAATRAAMTAGVSKADSTHVLPIALMTLGGEHLGAGEVEPAMRFLRKHYKKQPKKVMEQLLSDAEKSTHHPHNYHLAPGFGARFNGIDPLQRKLANHLSAMPGAGSDLHWGMEFAECLAEHNMGWLHTGLAAAVFADLGFQPRAAAGLYQFCAAPGLVAHGVEQSNKKLTDMPFIKDENYFIDYEN